MLVKAIDWDGVEREFDVDLQMTVAEAYHVFGVDGGDSYKIYKGLCFERMRCHNDRQYVLICSDGKTYDDDGTGLICASTDYLQGELRDLEQKIARLRDQFGVTLVLHR